MKRQMQRLMTCAGCGDKFVPARSDQQFCDRSCKQRSYFGERPPISLGAAAAAPATPIAEPERFGSWTLLKIDAVQKRAVCRCKCGLVREVAVDALRSGIARSCHSCGARGAPVERDTTFAFRVAADQGVVAAGRHRGRR
jgi:hypothetical protein